VSRRSVPLAGGARRPMATTPYRRLHYLGPPGTFSERAARQLAGVIGAPELVPEPSFGAVVAAAAQADSAGVLPYYNLLEGLIQEAVDLAYEHDLTVVDAVRIPVCFAAGSRDGRLDHPAVASHPKALAQCSEFLAARAPRAQQRAVSSTADAARTAVHEDILALAPEETLRAHGLQIVQRDVGNRVRGRVNFTDFMLVVRESSHAAQLVGVVETARSLVAVSPRGEHPGLLAGILQQFAYYGLNIAKVHSRPAIEVVHADIEPKMFWIEVMAGVADQALTRCLQALAWRFDTEHGRSVRLLGGWRELRKPRPEIPPPELECLSPALIVGVNGGMGRLFTELLLDAGISVRGADLHPEPASRDLAAYSRADASSLPSELASVRWVLLCVPEDAVVAAMPSLATLDVPLVSDVASVKSRIADALRSHPPRDWLSLHPMFAPALGMRGQNVCTIPLGVSRDLERYHAVEGLLERAGARVTEVDAEQHDRITAVLQAATHTALLALGRALADGGFEPATALRLATPINLALLAMLARMTTGDPELHASIQADNPFAADARQRLTTAIADLDTAMRSSRRGEMASLFDACRAILGDETDRLVQAAGQVAELLAGVRASEARDK
jgi:4-amino-4-deoxyprephenate dehydrogenase